MSDFDNIYQLRALIDLRFQPRHSGAYNGLQALLASHSIHEPYSRRPKKEWQNIVTDELFLSVREGLPATIPTDSGIYFYRVTSLDTLIARVSSLKLLRSQSKNSAWRALVRRWECRPAWIALDSLFEGELTGFRGHTWWTTADLSNNTFCTGHNTGMPDDWIPTRALILRCPSSALHALGAEVPSALHGFTQPVFFPTSDDTLPDMGRCISLERLPLSVGDGREVVCRSIPAGEIECLPLSLTRHPSDGHQVKLKEILPDLIVFYQTLSKPEAER
jgi:hypothetical protein